MEFDPYLYVAFLAGLVAGWVVRPRSAWVGRATLATVGALVGLLGASLSGIPAGSLLATVPLALAYASLILLLTALVYFVLARRRVPGSTPPAGTTKPDGRVPLSLLLLGALLAGYGLGHVLAVPTAEAIPWALYALLALVAFDLRLRTRALGRLWVPLLAAVGGALGAATVFIVLGEFSAPIALATALAFGWYTLAGPLVGARAGALLGLMAFLTNFLREDLTMLLAPVFGRRLQGEGMSALGGATSMDTTLYFVTRYGDAEAGSLALASGLVLTVAASLLLPIVLALP
ncbi:MAG: lysine exporter LysO family protein [Thermoplasmata archaeon]|nr:lysine exporter LysO family protein [Thermoplasmata archaeon]